MNDVVVFSVGLFVSTLVVFGFFVRVVFEMRVARQEDELVSKEKRIGEIED